MGCFSSAITLFCLCVIGSHLVEAQELGTVRLVNSANPSEGRVEIYYQGVWGTVCDDLWDRHDATVVCRQLGYPGPANATSNAFFGEGYGKIWLDDVECDGTESGLDECWKNAWGDHNCLHSEDAGVKCFDECPLNTFQCDNGLCISPSWECDGYDDCGDTSDEHQGCFTDQCSESSEFQCLNGACIYAWLECDGNDDCGDRSDEANCLNGTKVRLVGGSNSSEGRVEVYYQGEWGTVCDDYWDERDATVVCRQLGFSGPAIADAFFGEGSGEIWLDDVECIGNETTLLECHRNDWGDDNCGHYEDVGVICLEECSSYQFQCENGVCILGTEECDGFDDCGDNSDEHALCYSECSFYDFQCENGDCISGSWECDGYDDCGDNSDEPLSCPSGCSLSQFECENGNCIFASWECDGYDDCGDNSDEPISCPSGCSLYDLSQFECENGNCISASWECDGYDDCGDNSDEPVSCPSDQCLDYTEFRCANGDCISDWLVCDGYYDCADATDEINCTKVRLVGGSNTFEGRVEVFYNGEWGTVCDDDWDDLDATVVCRQIGFPGPANATSYAFFGEGSGEIWLDNVQCTGWESSINECLHNGWGVEDCLHYEDAGVICHKDCSLDEFQCDNGICIYSSWECDGYDDCGDMSDEHTVCPLDQCLDVEFECENGGCIFAWWECDGDNDCGDGSDEKNCLDTCPTDSFQCGSGTCIYSSWECDGIYDCSDLSDEHQGCPDYTSIIYESTPWIDPWSSSSSCPDYADYECPVGWCIPYSFICDGYDDCGDYTDEKECGWYSWFESSTGPPPVCFGFTCPDGSCIYDYQVCDGYNDCGNFTDEQQSCTCDADEYQCTNGLCIFWSWQCDGDNDCGDNSDEQECYDSVSCGTYQYTCPNGFCIPNDFVCDGFNDCGDWAEETCGFECGLDEFTCDNEFCISPYWVCDGSNDCGDLSDETEALCDLPPLCGGVLTDISGTITSPSFPSNYPNSTNCTWIILGQEESTIELKFTRFTLENPDSYWYWDNCYDWLQIREFAWDPYATRYCGDSIPPTYTSSGSTLWIQFVSDDSIVDSGFRANYQIDTTNMCQGVTCSNGGSCIPTENDYRCLCQDGYNGRHCEHDETEINMCQYIRCDNGGSCETDGDIFECRCLAGYEGTYCHIDINECSSNPCQNGGQCTDMVNEFACTCPSGFEGLKCETKINEATAPVDASLTIVLEEEFVPQLMDSTSTEYQELAREFEMLMNDILRQRFGGAFDRSEVTGFREGSVEVYFDAHFVNPPEDINDPALLKEEITVQLEEAIIEETSAGNLGRFTVRPGSVNVGSVSSSRIGKVGCEHPGSLTNGFVIPDRSERYNLGQKVDLVCREGYMLDGSSEIFCTDKMVWSHPFPQCIEERNERGNLPVIVGIIVGVVVIIIVILLVAVLCKKSKSGSASRPESTVVFFPEGRKSESEADNGHRRNTYQSQLQQAPANVAYPGLPPNPPEYIDIINDSGIGNANR